MLELPLNLKLFTCPSIKKPRGAKMAGFTTRHHLRRWGEEKGHLCFCLEGKTQKSNKASFITRIQQFTEELLSFNTDTVLKHESHCLAFLGLCFMKSPLQMGCVLSEHTSVCVCHKNGTFLIFGICCQCCTPPICVQSPSFSWFD